MFIEEERFRRIAQRLLTKTSAGDVLWKVMGPDRKSFVVNFEKSRVRLAFESPRAEPDKITLSVLDDSDQPVDDWLVYEGEDDWKLLHGLFLKASISATGWDKVVEDVENNLQREGQVGLPDQDLASVGSKRERVLDLSGSSTPSE